MARRREVLCMVGAMLWAGGDALAQVAKMEGKSVTAENYGRIGQMKAAPGKRDELIGYLLAGSEAMPGNLTYIVAKDGQDADLIWITEVWRDAASHKASLGLPQVQEAITKARPIIAGFGLSAEVVPVGGRH